MPEMKTFTVNGTTYNIVDDTARTNASNAQTTAVNAQTAADDAQTTANEAKDIANSALQKSGGIITGTVAFKPENGTSIITTEIYRNLPSNSPTASYKTRNVITSTGAEMQFLKGELNAEPAEEVNKLTLTESDTQLIKPLTISSGGTGASTATDARTNIGAAPTGYGLGDIGKLLTESDDLNTTWRNGWYYWRVSIPTNSPFGSQPCVMHVQNIDYNDSGHIAINQEVISMNSSDLNSYATVYRNIIVDKTTKEYVRAGVWEYEHADMQLSKEYCTTERWKGKPVYVQSVNIGNLPSSASKSVTHGITGITGLVSLKCIAQTSTGTNGFEFAYGGTAANINKVGDNLIVKTNFNASDYVGVAIVKYTKN